MANRVYELSKKFGISNKELLKLLHDEGFDITSHAAAVPPQAIAIIEKKLSPGSAIKPAKEPVSKAKASAKIPEKKVEKVSKEVSKLKESKPEIAVKQKLEAPKVEEVSIKAPEKPIVSKEAEVALPEPKKEAKEEPSAATGNAIVIAPMTVSDIAAIARKPVSEVILTLLKQGIAAAKNKILPEKVVAQLAQLYELKVVEKKQVVAQAQVPKRPVSQTADMVERQPIVVVIGHVDHGKTTLLDFIRKTRVAAKEKGGITQHLGAYQVSTPHGGIVFLDTPGHEAFSMMRARGIKVADIAILVIAADDGVMPQTIEAIKHAKAAQIPIIVAINKIDKATPVQIETVKRQLAQHDLAPEEWGGQTVCVPISAKFGQGVDELLEVVSLQAQLMELTASLSVPARGYVLESKLEKGRGPVATILCQQGELHVGDYFMAGTVWGKVSSLVDSFGNRVTKVGPSIPVQVAGFSVLPHTGDPFEVVAQSMLKKNQPPEETRPGSAMTKSAEQGALNIIIKTDNASSKEALLVAIAKVSAKSPKEFNIIHAAIGMVTDSDIMLAANTHATIYGLHVKTESSSISLAQKHGVIIKHFDIIYKLLEDLEMLAQAAKPIKLVRKKIGEAIVLKVFDIKDLGVIAGAQVKSGRFTRDGKVVIWRGKQKVGEGAIKSLQRDRKAVKEVHAGFECAFLVDGFDAWEVDDRVECFNEVPE